MENLPSPGFLNLLAVAPSFSSPPIGDVIALAAGTWAGPGGDVPLLAVVTSGPDELLVYVGATASSFPSQLHASWVLPDSPVAVALGHFDDDAFLDIAVLGNNDKLFVAAGAGSPLSSFPLLFGTQTAWSTAGTLVTTDVDGDGLTDLALAALDDSWMPRIHVLLNRTDAAGLVFEQQVESVTPSGLVDLPTSMIAQDLDLDGRPDLAVTMESYGGARGALVVLENATIPEAIGDGVWVRFFSNRPKVDVSPRRLS